MLRASKVSRARNDTKPDAEIDDSDGQAIDVDNENEEDVNLPGAEAGDDVFFSIKETSSNSAIAATARRNCSSSKDKHKHYRSVPSISKCLLGLVIGATFVVKGVTFSYFLGDPSTNELSFQVKDSASVASNEDATFAAIKKGSEGIKVDEATTSENIHLVFSTDCSSYQHWQSYLLFFSALDIQQPGMITRIASGCEGSQLEEMTTWHKTYIRPMSNNFSIHFTPSFSAAEKDGRKTEYKYFNKPFGLLHFLQNFEPDEVNGVSDMAADRKVDLTMEPKHLDLHDALLFSSHFREKGQEVDKDVIILLDPDQIFLRPISGDLSPSDVHMPRTTVHPDGKKLIGNSSQFLVRTGTPMAQRYGLGSSWKKLDLKIITGTDTSPAQLISDEDAKTHYPVGPPYLGTPTDMYRISWYWSTFVPKVHAQYPHLLAEMYAYCIAAAHIQLPHIVFSSLMISSQTMSEKNEGWGFLNNIPDAEVCAEETIQTWTNLKSGLDASHQKASCPSSLPDCHAIRQELPQILHYCQRYMVQEWFFGKRKYDKYFTCESPILETPPIELGEAYDYRVRPGDPVTEHMPLRRSEAKHSAFMICRMTKALQDAARYFKARHCSNHSEVNLDENLNLFRLFYVEKE